MAGPFTLHNPDGSPKAGDAVLDKNMVQLAIDIGGYITDDSTGETVFPAGTHQEV